MKKLTILLFAAMLPLMAIAQSETDLTIRKADSLIGNKKYESAFKLLQNFDPNNGKPDIVLLKEKIALNYFVTSMMHQMFAFKDLKENEDIMDYRGKAGSYEMYSFPVDKILDSLIQVYPDNCSLYKGLGDFYFDAQQRYGGHWLKTDNELFHLIDLNYNKVIKGGCADNNTYYTLGYIALNNKKYKDAIPYFLKSIALDDSDADAHYNLAYAYLYNDEQKKAIEHAKASLDLYTDQGDKGDAARMLGEIYFELKDDSDAINNYELAEKIDSENYYDLRPLLNLYVKTENPKEEETRDEFFHLDPANPTIYNDLFDIYSSYKKEENLIAFFKKQLAVTTNDQKVQGGLNFYLGKLYLGIDKDSAKSYFLNAKEIFSKIYDKDNQVFTAIKQGIKEAEK